MLEWLNMGVADLGRGIEAGAIDPVALTETYLSAIDSHSAQGRIYSAITRDRALAEAAAAAERAFGAAPVATGWGADQLERPV